ncbi:hypothetical protein ACVWWP_005873 [Bradyrhizobium sp. LM3.6]
MFMISGTDGFERTCSPLTLMVSAARSSSLTTLTQLMVRSPDEISLITLPLIRSNETPPATSKCVSPLAEIDPPRSEPVSDLTSMPPASPGIPVVVSWLKTMSSTACRVCVPPLVAVPSVIPPAVAVMPSVPPTLRLSHLTTVPCRSALPVEAVRL